MHSCKSANRQIENRSFGWRIQLILNTTMLYKHQQAFICINSFRHSRYQTESDKHDKIKAKCAQNSLNNNMHGKEGSNKTHKRCTLVKTHWKLSANLSNTVLLHAMNSYTFKALVYKTQYTLSGVAGTVSSELQSAYNIKYQYSEKDG